MVFKILKRNANLGIDNVELSFSAIRDKLEEEYKEVEAEIKQENWWQLGLEVMDLIQVCILILWRLSLNGISIHSLNKEHNKKLDHRAWETERIINVEIEDTKNMP